MKILLILLSFVLILSMGCIGGQSPSASADSLNSIDDSDFVIGDPGLEDMEEDPTPVDVSSQ